MIAPTGAFCEVIPCGDRGILEGDRVLLGIKLSGGSSRRGARGGICGNAVFCKALGEEGFQNLSVLWVAEASRLAGREIWLPGVVSRGRLGDTSRDLPSLMGDFERQDCGGDLILSSLRGENLLGGDRLLS